MPVTQKNNIKNYLDRSHPFEWKVSLPPIIPQYISRDLEQILETKKKNSRFKIVTTFLKECPLDIEWYQAHEKSKQHFFRTILDRKFKLDFLVVSGISHYMIAQNKDNEYVQWNDFLDKVICITPDMFYSYHPAYVGAGVVKYLSLVMDEYDFDNISSEITGAGFIYEHYSRGSSQKKIPVYSVKIPIGSIIQMTFRP